MVATAIRMCHAVASQPFSKQTCLSPSTFDDYFSLSLSRPKLLPCSLQAAPTAHVNLLDN